MIMQSSSFQNSAVIMINKKTSKQNYEVCPDRSSVCLVDVVQRGSSHFVTRHHFQIIGIHIVLNTKA